MAVPYSYDLRKKAIEAVKRGQRKTDVCRFLKLSRNTLDLWLKREKETGGQTIPMVIVLEGKDVRLSGVAKKEKEPVGLVL